MPNFLTAEKFILGRYNFYPFFSVDCGILCIFVGEF